MSRKLTTVLFIWILAQLLAAAITDAQTLQGKSQTLTPQAGSSAVSGSGTTGRIAKWTGVDGANTYTLGSSIIFEDKFGKVGIGTTNPTSTLTVQGTIETTLGGYKFPDGTVQTTAATNGLSSVIHDATLTGNGTIASPLSVVAQDPAKSAFQASLGLQFASNAIEVSGDIITVPAGKRLVIEYVSVLALDLDPASFITACDLKTTVNGGEVSYYILPIRVPEGANGLTFVADKQVRIYADGGSIVKIKFARFTGSNSAFGNISISGHLVDMP